MVNVPGPEERLSGWLLARLERKPLPERLDALAEAGSFAHALRLLDTTRAERDSSRAERAIARLDRNGYRLLLIGDEDYPRLLKRIHDPPIALTLRGRIFKEDALGLSVVGSRRATPYGRETSRRLARDLARSGLTIVSGLARGIDAAAHEGALEAEGRTLAVLGSGLDNLYPREHRKLAERVAERGAVLSELDLDEPPHAKNFPRRNRIITGLTLGTLVIEAAAKSGSLVSARLAAEQNREVFAVPGPVSSPTSEGVHGLLRDGARLVTRAEDVLEELRAEVRDALRHKASSPPSSPSDRARLDPEEQAIVTRLLATHDALDLDQILDRLSLPIDRALAALSRLELSGRISSLAGGLFRAKRN